MPDHFFQRVFTRLLSFIQRKDQKAEPFQPKKIDLGNVTPVTHKVSLIILDPLMNLNTGQRMVQTLGWNDPDRLAADFIADIGYASYGYANYLIVEKIVEDAFPPLADGFRYTPETYLRCWRSKGGWHRPEGVDYYTLLAAYDLVPKIDRGEIDEVWTIGFPYGGFFESRMAGPGAFWCNSPPLEHTSTSRRFIIMGFSFERGVGEMLESYGHRAESILEYVHRNIPPSRNLWKRFTRYERSHPGQAEVGNIHFAPNSRSDYDWGNRTPVLSRSRAWLNFPDLSAPPRQENCLEWGEGDIRSHHLWWLSHLPHVGGETEGILNNWWAYILDPNLAA